MFWIEWLIAIGISALAVGITYAVTRDDIDQIELSDTVERLADAVNYIARRFQAAIALMLGFYSVQNINRWNQVRDVQGNVMGTVNDVAYRVALMLPDDNIVDERNDEAEEDGEEAAKSTKASISKSKLRLNLMRWLNLSHAIVIGDVYQTRHNEFNSLEKIRDKGLATEQEYYFLKEKQAETGFVFVAPLAWFVDLLEQLRREELFGVTEGMIGTLTGQLLTLRRALSDLYRFRNVPIPLSYRQLTNMTVRLYLLLLLLQAVLFEKDNEDSVGRLTRGSFLDHIGLCF
jgi:predicted membrane chloride channel (bestrophin family)